MFLGSLSNASEQKAKKKSKKKPTGSSNEPQDEKLKLLEPGATPVEFKTTVPRDHLMDYLSTCVKMMMDVTNQNIIIDNSINNGIALHVAAMDFQRDVLENNFGIEKNFGCQYMSAIPQNHPTDTELQEAAKLFMFTAMKSYVSLLKLRKEKYDATPALAPDGRRFGRNDMLEFFEGCNSLMILPETKKELKDLFQSTRQPPGPKVIEMQRSILVLMGFNPDKAIEVLNKVNEEFRDDKEILMKMNYFGACAQTSTQEACMSDEERRHFYSQIPPMMHHFPHIWVMQQKQMQMQRQMQMQGGNPTMSGGGGGNAAALKASGVLDLLSKPEGRATVSQLAARVQKAREKMESEVAEWSDEKKSSFFQSFADHPLVAMLSSSVKDPISSITRFVDMTEEDLEQMMSFMLVSAADNGKLMREFNTAHKPDPEKGIDDNTLALNRIVTTMGSLANVKYSAPSPQGHNHDHSHGHGHGHGHGGHVHSDSCSHGAAPAPRPPDVSTGKSATMER